MSGRALGELADVAPSELLRDYERWLAEPRPSDGYLFDEARVRFEPRDEDIVVPAPGLRVTAGPNGARLTAGSLPNELELAGVPADALARFVSACDGERSLAAARDAAKLDAATLGALLERAFGIVLFSPLAVAELEQRLPAHEIVRFPGSPYEILRAYWRNAASVRRRIPTLVERLSQPLSALDELRRLHVTTLLGEDLASFYRPASPIAAKGVGPGRLWLAAPKSVETEHGTRFVAGPRVNASFLGGARYAELVAEAAGDPDGASERREHRDAGLDWGRVARGRAEGEREDGVWFCPPRPLLVEHVEALFASLSDALSAAERGDAARAVASAADFHQRFVRLHPFRAGNQALAMNVVNFVLDRASAQGNEPAGGIPHLTLDHVALRLSPAAYRRVFSLAVATWRHRGSRAERPRFYAERKRLCFAFVARVASAADGAEAKSIARSDPEGARAALVLGTHAAGG